MNNIKYYLSKTFKKLRFSSIRYSSLASTSKIESGTSFVNSSLGRHSFCGYDCDIFYTDIGNFTSIASGVILGGAEHPISWVGMSPVFYKGRDSIKKKFIEYDLPAPKRTFVGNDVWIGRNAIVLSGVNIGDGAVVGAGAVVTRDVPSYAVVVGNPARIIKHRFEEETIENLIKTRWWDLPDEKIELIAKHCKSPIEFIKNLEKTLS